jgi:hypothetical protein
VQVLVSTPSFTACPCLGCANACSCLTCELLSDQLSCIFFGPCAARAAAAPSNKGDTLEEIRRSVAIVPDLARVVTQLLLAMAGPEADRWSSSYRDAALEAYDVEQEGRVLCMASGRLFAHEEVEACHVVREDSGTFPPGTLVVGRTAQQTPSGFTCSLTDG